jgi:hypothetical protein
VKYWLRRNNSLYDWLVWEVMRYVARKEIRKQRRRVAAAGVVALVLVAGFAAARRSSEP